MRLDCPAISPPIRDERASYGRSFECSHRIRRPPHLVRDDDSLRDRVVRRPQVRSGQRSHSTTCGVKTFARFGSRDIRRVARNVRLLRPRSISRTLQPAPHLRPPDEARDEAGIEGRALQPEGSGPISARKSGGRNRSTCRTPTPSTQRHRTTRPSSSRPDVEGDILLGHNNNPSRDMKPRWRNPTPRRSGDVVS